MQSFRAMSGYFSPFFNQHNTVLDPPTRSFNSGSLYERLASFFLQDSQHSSSTEQKRAKSPERTATFFDINHITQQVADLIEAHIEDSPSKNPIEAATKLCGECVQSQRIEDIQLINIELKGNTYLAYFVTIQSESAHPSRALAIFEYRQTGTLSRIDSHTLRNEIISTVINKAESEMLNYSALIDAPPTEALTRRLITGYAREHFYTLNTFLRSGTIIDNKDLLDSFHGELFANKHYAALNKSPTSNRSVAYFCSEVEPLDSPSYIQRINSLYAAYYESCSTNLPSNQDKEHRDIVGTKYFNAVTGIFQNIIETQPPMKELDEYVRGTCVADLECIFDKKISEIGVGDVGFNPTFLSTSRDANATIVEAKIKENDSVKNAPSTLDFGVKIFITCGDFPPPVFDASIIGRYEEQEMLFGYGCKLTVKEIEKRAGEPWQVRCSINSPKEDRESTR